MSKTTTERTAATILDELDMTVEELTAADAKVQARKAIHERTESLLEQVVDFPHSVELRDDSVHLFQKIYEDTQNPLDDSIVEWTVCGLSDDEVLLKDSVNWSRAERVAFDDWDPERYEPQTLSDGTPRFSY